MEEDGGGFKLEAMIILLLDQCRCHCHVDSSSPKFAGDTAIAGSEEDAPLVPTVAAGRRRRSMVEMGSWIYLLPSPKFAGDAAIAGSEGDASPAPTIAASRRRRLMVEMGSWVIDVGTADRPWRKRTC
ncbi:hypothetical protein ACLOJK_038753 [Asimina triloba]